MYTEQQNQKIHSDPITVYYERYSQNRQLPKYFCGSSVCYLPPIAGDSNAAKNESAEVEKLVQSTQEENHEAPLDEVQGKVYIQHEDEMKDDRFVPPEGDVHPSKNMSPTSSITSNKKLEWDNGADIGYNNYYKNQIHRSASLPILPHSQSDRRIDTSVPKTATVHEENIDSTPALCISSSSIDVDSNFLNVFQAPSSSSSKKRSIQNTSESDNYMIKNVLSKSPMNTPSSSSSLERDKISHFSSKLSYLKKIIGIPFAESTPNEEAADVSDELRTTPYIKKGSKADKILSSQFHRDIVSDVTEHASSKTDEEKCSKSSDEDKQSTVSSSCEHIPPEKHLPKSYSQGDVHALKYIQCSQRKIVNLCKTKAVVVECFDIKKSGPTKKVQTSAIAEKFTKSTQTDALDENILINIIQDSASHTQNQNIVLIEISSSMETEFSKSSLTQTDATNFTSNESGSFQYFSGDVPLPKEPRQGKENSLTELNNFPKTDEICQQSSSCNSANLKRTQARQDLSKASTNGTSSRESSKYPPLGNFASAQHSEKLLTDIDKSIMLLQKLVNSRKYDAATKKHYIKRIVQRMVDSKCLEDTSTSSELFIPKKATSHKIDVSQQGKPDRVVSSVDNEDRFRNQQDDNSLKNNVPWYPVQLRASPRKPRKLQMQTHSEEIVPELEDKYRILLKPTDGEHSVLPKIDISPREISDYNYHYSKSKLLTSDKPNQIANKNQRTFTSSSSAELLKKNQERSQSLDVSNESGPYTNNNNNWREDRTLSEKLLEQHATFAMAQGDNLLHYAKNERKHQISWINNEINHLSKLKYLLEKKPKTLMEQDYLYGKSLVNDMNAVKKTTTVYMVAENYTGKSSEATSPYCSAQGSHASSAKSGRNFVIHTEFTDSASSNEMNFKFIEGQGEKNYTCKEVRPLPHLRGQSQEMLVGDIRVSSENNTTNITVQAKRPESAQSSNLRGRRTNCICLKTPCICCSGFMPKQPSLIGQGVYRYSTFPRSSTEVKFSGTSRYDGCKIPGTVEPGPTSLAGESSNNHCCACVSKKGSLTQEIEASLKKEHGSNKSCCCTVRRTGNLEISVPFTYSVDPVISDEISKKVATKKNTDVVCKLLETQRGKRSTAVHSSCVKKICRCNWQAQKQQFKNISQNDVCQCCGKTKHAECKPVLTSKSSYKRQIKCNCSNKSEKEGGVQFSNNTGVQCSCIIENCRCNETVQTHQNQQDENDQFQCLCNTQELQVTCECKEENQQTESCQADENVQNDCICHTAQMQTLKNVDHNEKQQTVDINKYDTCLQTECKCAEDGVQCECICNTSDASQTCTDVNDGVENLKLTCTESPKCEYYCNKQSSGKGSTQMSTSSSEASETSSAESLAKCVCCKQNNIGTTFASLSNKLRSGAQPLCYPCMKQNQRTPWAHRESPFNSPNHVCRCYTLVQTATFNEVKKTIDELNCLEQLEQCCTFRNTKHRRSSKYCKCKLKDIEKNRNGIAYMLTFEYEKARKKRHKHNFEPKLEEIKIKIPCPYSKKKHKDKENTKRKVKCRSETDETISGTNINQNSSLQYYLRTNRPDFIQNLEKRRRAVFNCKTQREENEELKKLLYLKDHQASVKLTNPSVVRCFTSKQMKEITEKNYRKLPEVQDKLIATKKTQLKQANRLIAEQFNEKLRAQVLKGKRSLPTCVNVVSLVCTERNTK